MSEKKIVKEKAVKKETGKAGEPKVSKDFYYGTGRRKCAIAKAWLFAGSGQIFVNNKPMEAYFPRPLSQTQILSPLELLGLTKKYNLKLSVLGGGLSGQAEAARLAVARALLVLNAEFRKELKPEGFLTRDPRIKERKKYGRKRARKGYQYRKR